MFQVCTTLLGVSRFIKVWRPFYQISVKKLVVYVTAHFFYMLFLVGNKCSVSVID